MPKDAFPDVESVMDDNREQTEPNPQDTLPVKAVVMNGMSFREMEDAVRQKWEQEYGSGYVAAVYEKHAVVLKDRRFWKIPYSRTDTEITIAANNEWTEMKPNQGFTEKFIEEIGSDLMKIKSIGNDRVGGYAILWGDETKRDLHGNWFTKHTAEIDSILKQMGAIPYLYQHGADNSVKSIVMGQVVSLEPDDIGVWFEAQIREHEAYKKYVQPMMDKEALYPSSGVLPAAMRYKKSGEITRWPIVEVTATNKPAEYRMLNIPISQVNKFYKMAGLDNLVEDEEEGGDSEKEALELGLKLREQELRLLEVENL